MNQTNAMRTHSWSEALLPAPSSRMAEPSSITGVVDASVIPCQGGLIFAFIVPWQLPKVP